MVLTLTFREILKRENKKMDQREQEAQSGEAAVSAEDLEKFRYIY